MRQREKELTAKLASSGCFSFGTKVIKVEVDSEGFHKKIEVNIETIVKGDIVLAMNDEGKIQEDEVILIDHK